MERLGDGIRGGVSERHRGRVVEGQPRLGDGGADARGWACFYAGCVEGSHPGLPHGFGGEMTEVRAVELAPAS
jgi:hypothetical protein